MKKTKWFIYTVIIGAATSLNPLFYIHNKGGS